MFDHFDTEISCEEVYCDNYQFEENDGKLDEFEEWEELDDGNWDDGQYDNQKKGKENELQCTK